MVSMTDEKLVAVIDAELSNAGGLKDSDVSKDRERALDYYYRKPLGNERPGRSNIVTGDVLETIEWAMPPLMRIFWSSNKVVEFTPKQPGDEEFSDQATDYVQYIITRDNPGFFLTYDWFKDALLSKNGILKYWWDDSTEIDEETYTGISEAEWIDLTIDPEVKVLEHTEHLAAPNQMYVEPTHDIKIRRTTKVSRVKIEGVAPEEFVITRNAKSIPDATLVGHNTKMTRSELVAAGHSEDVINGLSTDEDGAEKASEYLARHGESTNDGEGTELDRSRDRFTVFDGYVKADYDGDGISELRHVIKAGKTVLLNEVSKRAQFVSTVPIRMPHKFNGVSLADLVWDLQIVHSQALRGMFDNMEHAIRPRWLVGDEADANMNDFLSNDRPGGVIRAEGDINQVKEVVTSFSGQAAIPVLDILEKDKAKRTGVSQGTAGLDPDVLSNQTAAATHKMSDAEKARIELIARCFGDAYAELALGILELVIRHQDKERVIRLRDEWVPMDPRSWNAKMDVDVNVGLGSGNRERDLNALNLVAAKQEALLMKAGPNNGIVTKRQYAKTLQQITEVAGLKNSDNHFTVPEDTPEQPQTPPPDPKMIEIQGKLALEEKKIMLEHQRGVMEIQGKLRLKGIELQAEAVFEEEKIEQGLPGGNGNLPAMVH